LFAFTRVHCPCTLPASAHSCTDIGGYNLCYTGEQRSTECLGLLVLGFIVLVMVLQLPQLTAVQAGGGHNPCHPGEGLLSAYYAIDVLEGWSAAAHVGAVYWSCCCYCLAVIVWLRVLEGSGHHLCHPGGLSSHVNKCATARLQLWYKACRSTFAASAHQLYRKVEGTTLVFPVYRCAAADAHVSTMCRVHQQLRLRVYPTVVYLTTVGYYCTQLLLPVEYTSIAPVHDLT
jgi:hypothetical protein